MTIKRTNDKPLFEAVIETKEDEKNWERIMGRKKAKWSFDDTFSEDNKLVLAEIAHWVLENDLMRDSIGEHLDLNDVELDKLRDDLAEFLGEDEFTEDALLNHEVMSGEIQSDIEFPDGEFPNGNEYKYEWDND